MIKTNEVTKLEQAYNKKANYPAHTGAFTEHAKRYIKAIRDGRMLCSIDTVSRSGMSRTMRFMEMQRNPTTRTHQMLNFYQFFLMLGYSPANDSDHFRINGCGMDMVFATNYNIIHKLHRLGFISKADCAKLAQKTPHVI